MTALENVAAPLELAGAPDAFERAESRPRGGGSQRPHRPLSGAALGRRAAARGAGRALSPRPAVLIADEPTGNLDEATGQAIIDLLFAARTQGGATLVLVTHDPALAARCDRTLIMRSGRLEAAAAAPAAA